MSKKQLGIEGNVVEVETKENENIVFEYKDKRVLFGKEYNEGYDAILAVNDVLEFLKKVPDNIATLIVTSPPYNIGKPYEEIIEFQEYLNWQKDVIKECARILKPEGNICWEVGNYIDNGEVFPLDIFFYQIFKELGFKLRNRIIWYFGHGLHASNRFSGRYETILWFSKSDNYIFNLDPVRVPQKYPKKKSYKGANKGELSSNPLGKNPSDIWEILLRDWEKELWNIPNVKSNHPEKTEHPCQFPIELVERLVLALSNQDDWVFDPFAGVGSSLIAGLLHGRKVMGVDKEKGYMDTSYQRIIDTLKGTLKKREFGKPVYDPKQKSKNKKSTTIVEFIEDKSE